MKDYILKNFDVDKKVLDLVFDVEAQCKDKFEKADKIAGINQMKVLKAFADNKVSEAHFAYTTGYGYDDLGRDTLDKIYAQAFGAEDAIVRHTIISGTHALSSALFGVLRPGDCLLAVTGKPYDTLEQLIGISGNASGSLKDFGINYVQVDLKEDGSVDFEGIKKAIEEHPNVKMAMLQRSKGYDWRPTLSIDDIEKLVSFIKSIRSDIICFTDNCYGEFIEEREPTQAGADLIAGSLIKNPGGGLAPTGGYIAGRRDLVELVSSRVTSVGIGKECGCSLNVNRSFYQGFFMAPHVASQALKAAILCAGVYEKLGFDVIPKMNDDRSDIIQAIRFGKPELVIGFCQGIQKGAPVDAYVTPLPWDMPGYQSQVIMAAGAFVQGASIELSADAPIKPPYIAYMQGGLTYESARFGIIMSAQEIMKSMGML